MKKRIFKILALAGLAGALTATNIHELPPPHALSSRLYGEEEVRFYKEGLDTIIPIAYNTVSGKPSFITEKMIKEMARKESQFDTLAESNAGARGVMQMKESAWAQVDTSNYLSNVYKPLKSFEASIKYLAKWIVPYCQKRNPNWNTLSDKSKRELTEAAYYAGTKRMEEADWNIDVSKGTRDYVSNIENMLAAN